jgi:hypothetical protein
MLQITKSRMTLLALQATPEYRRCSRRQRLFITTLIRSLIDLGEADVLYALGCAYQTGFGEDSRIRSYSAMKVKKIRDVLAVYQNFGKSPKTIRAAAKKAARQEYIDRVQAEMTAAPAGSAARARLVELYGKLMFRAAVSKPKKLVKGTHHGSPRK